MDWYVPWYASSKGLGGGNPPGKPPGMPPGTIVCRSGLLLLPLTDSLSMRQVHRSLGSGRGDVALQRCGRHEYPWAQIARRRDDARGAGSAGPSAAAHRRAGKLAAAEEPVALLYTGAASAEEGGSWAAHCVAP
jgi:hypothetical protein